MGFANRATNFDLSELNIERLFITDFMPVASGTYVKVYLMGYMLANSGQNTQSANHRTLANMLQLPLQDVLEAWDYWEKQGIIVKHFREDGDYDVAFVSLRELYIENNYEAKQKKRNPSGANRRPTQFTKNQETMSRLMKTVEGIVGHPLSPSEYKDLIDFFDHYYSDEHIITYAFDYNYKQKNRTGFKRVKALLDAWLNAGLTTLDSIKSHVEHVDGRQAVYKEILAVIGIRHRLAYQAECDAIDKWMDTYEFEAPDLVKIIKTLSTRTTNVNFNFLDAHMTDLNQKGIKDASTATSASAVKSGQSNQTTQTTPNSKRRHQYTVEKERTYTEDELEDMLLNKK